MFISRIQILTQYSNYRQIKTQTGLLSLIHECVLQRMNQQDQTFEKRISLISKDKEYRLGILQNRKFATNQNLAVHCVNVDGLKLKTDKKKSKTRRTVPKETSIIENITQNDE